MLPVLVDEDFNAHILSGILRRRSEFTFARVVEVGLGGRSDAEVLEWAAEREYVVVSHDARTMPRHAFERLRKGRRMRGLIIVPQSVSIATAIDELELVLDLAEAGELDGEVLWLPL